jgi:hypothetical protein
VDRRQALVLGQGHAHLEGPRGVHVAANYGGASPLFARV